MSRMHRLIFTKMGRSPQACAAFFWSLARDGEMGAECRLSSASAARHPLGPGRARARSEVKANLAGGDPRGASARHQGRAPGFAAVLRTVGAIACRNRRALCDVAGKRRHHRAAERGVSPRRATAQLPARCRSASGPLLGVRSVRPCTRYGQLQLFAVDRSDRTRPNVHPRQFAPAMFPRLRRSGARPHLPKQPTCRYRANETEFT